MKLPDFLEHAGLNDLRRQLGADRLGNLKLTADPNRLTEHELFLLTHDGIDIKSLDDLRVLPDGTLAHKDSRVLLYIRDVSIYRSGAKDGVRSLPRFHFAGCATLQQMQSERRFGRYVVAARQDGQFQVNIIEENKVVRSSPERLNVCQNCLECISFDGFSMVQSREERLQRVSDFRLTKFFEKYPRALITEAPDNRSDSAPLNTYPDDFGKLSEKVRSERGWRCEKCAVILSEPSVRKCLHVHHKNGQKFDSRPENLELLCLWCHAQEPQHAHMRMLPEYAEFERIRTRLLRRANVAGENTGSHRESASISDENYVRFAKQLRLAHQDHRTNGGALWIQVPAGQQQVLRQLKDWGFKYKGGRGWWHK